ncbi:hypothetical protein ACIQ4I_12255 [Rummeliibacillus sp. NPDC094406]|uniref:hypothetical protein n=1 Tax=Rummeliibacillus sp. NPDC094406 TaxID=3364511 RepID=UPI0037FF46D8
MLKRTKDILNRFYKFYIAIILILFLFYSIFILIVKGIAGDLDSLTLISLVAVILSIPGIINTFVDDLNPQKKEYKLTCNCPKCKSLIVMDMKEK